MDVRKQLSAARLYGIADLGYIEENSLETVVNALLKGGVDLLQLRAKSHEPAAIERFARRIHPLCDAAEVPLVINDHPGVAGAVNAPGLHLGQEDGPLTEARSVLSQEVVVGRSTHSIRQARAALREGADYIGFGPLFPTPTKEGRPGIGLEDIAAVEREVGSRLPVFCIGGIKLDNLRDVLAAGAKRVVIVSGLLQADDIAKRCRRVRKELDGC